MYNIIEILHAYYLIILISNLLIIKSIKVIDNNKWMYISKYNWIFFLKINKKTSLDYNYYFFFYFCCQLIFNKIHTSVL